MTLDLISCGIFQKAGLSSFVPPMIIPAFSSRHGKFTLVGTAWMLFTCFYQAAYKIHPEFGGNSEPRCVAGFIKIPF